MRFAKIVFRIAGIWGLLVLTPLYFLFDRIGHDAPPPITHPEFYFGFVGVGLAWQIAFLIIATDPVRFRLIMIPSIIEKFSYAIAVAALFAQHRVAPSLAIWGIPDTILGLLFCAAFAKARLNPGRA